MKPHIPNIVVLLLLMAACGSGTPSESELAPLRCKPEATPREYLVVLHDRADPEALALEAVERYGGEIYHVYTSAIKGFNAALTDEAVNVLRRNADVRYVECSLEVSPDPPAEGADIRGFITHLNIDRREFLVEGELEEDTQYDVASVSITEETRIFELVGKERRLVLFEALELGQRVEVQFIEPVLDSYPVQARAGEVVILE